MRKMLPMLGVLTGCGIDSMAGDWSGDLSCFDGAEVRLEVEVDDSEGALDYVGDFFLRAASQYETDGEVFRLESDWAGTLTLTQLLPSGEQEVALMLSGRVVALSVGPRRGSHRSSSGSPKGRSCSGLSSGSGW